MARFRAGHVVLALAVLLFAGCSSGDDPDVLSVAPDTASLDVGETQQLVAQLLTADGAPVAGATYAWSSSVPAVAAVSANGLVSGVTGGSATITVSSGGHSQHVEVTVASVATSIQVAPSTVNLVQGGVENLVVAVYNERGEVMPSAPTITFTTSGGIATVTPQGVVTAVGAGQGIITVTSGAASTNVPLVFIGHPAGVAGPRLTLNSRPFGVAIGPDSVLLATQLDAATMGRGRTNLASFAGSVPVGSVPTSVVIVPARDTAFVANQLSGNIGIVRLATGVQAGTIPIPGDPFRVILGNGPLIFVAGNSDSVFAINRNTQAIVARAEVGADPNGMALRTDGTTLYVTNMSSGTLSEVVLAGFTVARTFVLGGVPQDVVVSPDGTELYVANEGAPLQVIDLASGDVTNGAEGTDNLFGLALSPDGKVLVGTRPGLGQVVLIDRVSRQLLTTIATGGTPRRVAFDLLGSVAAVANESGWVDLIR